MNRGERQVHNLECSKKARYLRAAIELHARLKLG